ncbi:glycosyltransferase family 4 protein [Porticoccus sp.]|uniref:glycosyltransferase family 4 protein n=1 Tax=Porticoccus sp. TaxID=2024853 RepID=UPI003F69DEB4
MKSIRRLVLLNQMAGPLFRQLAEGLAGCYPDGAQLVTGHPDTLAVAGELAPNLEVVAAPGYDRRSRFRRVYSWFRYLFRITGRILFARKGDALLLVSNPPLLVPWVWLLSLLRPVPYGVLVYDIYPDVLEQMGLIRAGSLPSRLWRAVNRLVFRRARVVITIGAGMAARLQRQVGLDGAEVAVVPPWADVEMIRPLARAQNPYLSRFIEPEDIVVLYSGNMGASHDIDSMLAAAESLRPQRHIRFLFIGEGEKRAAVEAYIHRFPEGNVRLFPFQPEALLPYTLTLGDISLVSLDEGMEDLMVPSKVFSYLAAGSAILAIGNDASELSDVVDDYGCGMRVLPRQPEMLVAALLAMTGNPKLLAAFKSNARQLAEQRYSQRVGVQAFTDILEWVGLLY